MENLSENSILFPGDLTQILSAKYDSKNIELLNKQLNQVFFQIREEERARIAESLHNHLGQLLFGIKLRLEKENLYKVSQKELLALINEAIETTRKVSFELMPALLKDFGLKTSIDEYCKKVRTKDLFVKSTVGIRHRLKESLEITIFRIAQELINNIIKHSGAEKATISISEIGQEITIEAKDNGKGFNLDAPVKLNSSGISQLKKRIAQYDGTFEIFTNSETGTQVYIKLKNYD